MKWVKPASHAPNTVVEGDGFYLSYNPKARVVNPDDELAKLIQELGNALISDRIGPETALYNRKTNEWYILNGDFRKDYEPLVPQGFEACLKFYEKMAPEFRSNWSTDKF